MTTVRTEKHAGTFTHAEAFDFIPGVQQHFLVQVAWLERKLRDLGLWSINPYSTDTPSKY